MLSLSARRQRLLLAAELRDILRSGAFWGMMLILSLLVGYSFIQAAALFAEASRSAPPGTDAARGLSPLDGVLTPTFGAYYLALTLLFPFVAIRSLGAEKESGSMKLLLQLPVSPGSAVAAKACALSIAWVIALIPGGSAALLWVLRGGHLHVPELLNLLLGYTLYAFALAGVSIFASAVATSVSTAALAALALILGSWVLDFAGSSGSGPVAALAPLSLTAALRPFERGLFLTEGAFRLAAVGAGALGIASVLLPAAPPGRKLRALSLILLAAALAGLVGSTVRFSRDVSEDRRNSFSPGVESALTRIPKPLKITVHLTRDDSRFQDLERNILDRLRRAVPKLVVAMSEGDYGWIAYEYDGKSDRSTSNSEEEILPIIFRLTGKSAVAQPPRDYPGYPMAKSVGPAWLWFYLILPSLCLVGAAWCRRSTATFLSEGTKP
ncbi:MAG: ABC transporter permease subunit [Elusimicrobia bacterium]|nr:ABC transporter permease subunit [Elusimicrobiota bacterium]